MKKTNQRVFRMFNLRNAKHEYERRLKQQRPTIHRTQPIEGEIQNMNETNNLWDELHRINEDTDTKDALNEYPEKVIDTLNSIAARNVQLKTNDQQLEITFVGGGSGGGRNVDLLAGYVDANGKPIYNCIAINSHDGDLSILQNIPEGDHRIDLQLGGMEKDPEKGYHALSSNPVLQNTLHDIVTNKISTSSDLVVLMATLGGGTGTATIVKLLEELTRFYKLSYEEQIVEIIQQTFLPELGITFTEFRELPLEKKEYLTKLADRYLKENYKTKFAVVAYLPDDKNSSLQELQAVQKFTKRIWELASPILVDNENINPVSFVMFPDNQHFRKLHKAYPNIRKQFPDFEDFANAVVTSTLHEFLTIPFMSASKNNFDPSELKSAILQGFGYLHIAKSVKPLEDIQSFDDYYNMYEWGMTHSHMHSPLMIQSGNKYYSAFKSGIVGIMDQQLSSDEEKKLFFDGGFTNTIQEKFSENPAIQPFISKRAMSKGSITLPNNGLFTSYVFAKSPALPYRNVFGLKEEIEAMASQETIEDTMMVLEGEAIGLAFEKKEKKIDFSKMEALLASTSGEPKEAHEAVLDEKMANLEETLQLSPNKTTVQRVENVSEDEFFQNLKGLFKDKK